MYPNSSNFLKTISALSSILYLSVSIIISGFSGSSYGALTPVKSLIIPAFAFLYKPLGSLFSQVSREALVYISKNLPFPTNSLQKFLYFLYGDIKALIVEGNFTDDPLKTFGGYGVLKVENLQSILKTICREGLAHHVAVTLNEVGEIVYEALSSYLGFTVLG